jgi:hypothetical protein
VKIYVAAVENLTRFWTKLSVLVLCFPDFTDFSIMTFVLMNLASVGKAESISSGGAQYAILENIFHIPVSVIYFFATPPKKLKLGQQISRGLLRANHLDQSL